MLPEHDSHHRPRFHISQPAGYLNDPNGPIELGRTTHLFFQSRPTTDMAAPVEWGHATSDDLVQWTVHPSAMTPTAGGLDVDGCWSGNTLSTAEGLRAFYSGHDVTRPLERLITALSRDDGATFGSPELLLPDPTAVEDVRMLRDPFVWQDEQGDHMVAGSAVGDRAAIRLYAAVGGSSWRYVRELASMQRSVVRGVDTGEGWECPQIIRLGDRDMALVGTWSFEHGPSTVLAFPVDDAPRFDVFDTGDSFYAPSVMRDSSHGPVVFGWLRETRQADWWHEAGWAGAISLPRRVWLEGGLASPSLRSEPLPSLDRLRVGEVVQGDEAVIGAQAELALSHASGVTRITFGADEWLEFDLDIQGNALIVDRGRASRDDRAAREAIYISDAFDVRANRPAARVLLDGSTIEVFTSAGRSATTRVYPLSPPPWRVAAGEELLAWRLGSAVRDSQDLTADSRTGRVAVSREA